MRILHWTESFWPRIGGAEIFVGLLAQDHRRRGHECVVVSDIAEGLPPRDSVDGLPIRRFPFQAVLAQRDLHDVVSLAARATEFVREVAPDVIHVHTSQPGAFFFLRAHKALGIPSIFTTHDPQGLVGPDVPLLSQLLNTVQRIAGVSPFMVEHVVAAFPETKPRVRCITYGLPGPDRQPSSLPWNPPLIVAIGRMTPRKGFDVLVKALPRVRRAFADAALVVAGDGPCREELEELAHALGLHAHVTFPGWVPPHDIAALIDRATVLAVPSRWQESFGLVALEAMQMARPVVASRVGGLGDVVRHARTGLLVPPDDPDALGDALRDVLSDRDRATMMGLSGRDVARVEFDWMRCADSYEALYREVVR